MGFKDAEAADRQQQSCGLLVLEKVWGPWEVFSNWGKKSKCHSHLQKMQGESGKMQASQSYLYPWKDYGACLHVLKQINKHEQGELAHSLRPNHDWAP